MDLPGMGIFSRDSRIRLNLMDMQVKKGAGDEPGRRGELAKILKGEPEKLAEWCALADIKKWGISAERFAEELARCVEARFRDEQASVEELHAYVGAPGRCLREAAVQRRPRSWPIRFSRSCTG